MFIDLNAISKVKEFVEISQSCIDNVSLKMGRYLVDGKSILGIFSLDLAQPIELICDNSADFEKFKLFEA